MFPKGLSIGLSTCVITSAISPPPFSLVEGRPALLPVSYTHLDYFQRVTPIFRELRSRQEKHEKWRDIPDKKQRYYMPVLQAFSDELQRLFQVNPADVSRGLIHYLLGSCLLYTSSRAFSLSMFTI